MAEESHAQPVLRFDADLRKMLPLGVLLAFYVLTYGLYVSDLYIEYPDRNGGLLLVYLLVCALGISAGYLVGALCGEEPHNPFAAEPGSLVEKLALLGFVSSLLLFVPSVSIYTGQSLTNLLSLATDPARAYSVMVSTVTGTRDERLWFLLVKTVASPLMVVAVPYFSYSYFYRRAHGWKLLALVSLMFLTSVFRGTDKEIFDAVILVGGGYLVASLRKSVLRIERARLGRKALIFLVVLSVVFAIFSFRKTERIGENLYLCFKGTAICHPAVIDLGVLPGSLGSTMLIRYLTHGYHGLASALDGDFRSGHGLGHSRPLQYLGEKLLNADYGNLLSAQLDELGWAARGIWSTGIVWLANDVPLEFVPLLLFGLAYFLARSWREAVWFGDGLSLIVFVYLFFSFVYLPANLQLAQSGDFYIGFLLWFGLYLFRALAGRAVYGSEETHRLKNAYAKQDPGGFRGTLTSGS